MKQLYTDIFIIGCGAAGMAAASAAANCGAKVILADERHTPGGVLNQCIHKGFGLGRYGREMTGPEYCDEEYRRFSTSSAVYMPGTRVIEIRPDKSALLSGSEGMAEVRFLKCIIAAGCTERHLWSLPVSGTRPEGIYTAGEAQELTEIGGYDIGDRIFILGSGDIGQIMARRFVQLGKTVIGMAEIRDHLGGMKRNQEECIRAYNIPVMLNSTVTAIHGFPHICGITLRRFGAGKEADEQNRSVVTEARCFFSAPARETASYTDMYIECDTLVTALGLLPDRSLADGLKRINGAAGSGGADSGSASPGGSGMKCESDTSNQNKSGIKELFGSAGPGRSDPMHPEWLHFCGNADYVHEIADSASAQGERLGRQLAEIVYEER